MATLKSYGTGVANLETPPTVSLKLDESKYARILAYATAHGITVEQALERMLAEVN